MDFTFFFPSSQVVRGTELGLQKLRFANEQNNALVAVMPALQLGRTASLFDFRPKYSFGRRKSFSFKHSNDGFSITLFKKVNESGLGINTKNTLFTVESSCTFWQALASFLLGPGFGKGFTVRGKKRCGTDSFTQSFHFYLQI